MATAASGGFFFENTEMNATNSGHPRSARELYLDLLKKCLTDSIYLDDPLSGYILYRHKSDTPAWKRAAIDKLASFLGARGIRLVHAYATPWLGAANADPNALQKLRRTGRDWPARAHTMIGLERLDNLQYCLQTVLEEGVQGDFIETGVWRGGACIFMRGALEAYQDRSRKVWVADSFQGLPPPNAASYAADKGDLHHSYADWLAISRDSVAANFSRYGLLDGQVQFLEGWFSDTLHKAPIDTLAILRLDGDMYESTMQAISALYPKLSVGGFVIIDDYHLAPCAKAIHDYRAQHAITAEIQDIDGNGAYWRRTG
jgi:O-methyltransferase